MSERTNPDDPETTRPVDSTAEPGDERTEERLHEPRTDGHGHVADEDDERFDAG